MKTSFHLGGDSEQVSDWAAARTLLRALAEYPRGALKNLAYFFRGRQMSNEDLLTAMNVVEDPFVAEWFQPRSLQTAKEELEVLDKIDQSERSDRDRCELLLQLLHRSRPLDEIRAAADLKALVTTPDGAPDVDRTMVSEGAVASTRHDSREVKEAKLARMMDQYDAMQRTLELKDGHQAAEQTLRVIVMHDEAKLVRLIDFERDELKRNGRPAESIESLMQRAIDDGRGITPPPLRCSAGGGER